MFRYNCKQTFCKLYGLIVWGFIGLRMWSFPGIIFIWTQTYREVFKSELSAVKGTAFNCYLQIYKIYVYRILMKNRVSLAKPIYSVVRCCYLFSCVFVSAYKFIALYHSFWNAYQTVFAFIVRIWINDKTTQKWRVGICLPLRKFVLKKIRHFTVDSNIHI